MMPSLGKLCVDVCPKSSSSFITHARFPFSACSVIEERSMFMKRSHIVEIVFSGLRSQSTPSNYQSIASSRAEVTMSAGSPCEVIVVIRVLSGGQVNKEPHSRSPPYPVRPT